MKALLYLISLLSILACQQTTNKVPDEEDRTNKNEIIQEDSSISNEPVRDSTNLTIIINREQVARLNASMALIGSKIRETIFESENKLTMEELLGQSLTFRNNHGKMINTYIRDVVDTMYFEQVQY